MGKTLLSYSDVGRTWIDGLRPVDSVLRTLDHVGEVGQIFFVEHDLLEGSESVDLFRSGFRRLDLD